MIDVERLEHDRLEGTLNHDLVRSRYSYCPDTGSIFGSRGKPLKTKSCCGYIKIRVRDGGRYIDVLGHRLAFFLKRGRWPLFIDHINGIKTDNRWENLREVTPRENSLNLSLSKKSRTGVSGVNHRENGKFRAVIRAKDGRVNLGTFEDFFEAVCRRKAAEIYYGYHENHGRLSNDDPRI